MTSTAASYSLPQPAPPPVSGPARLDPRDLTAGLPIPKEGYCDQPYVVITPEGDWVCVLTTGPGLEGDVKQHVVSSRSTDQGQSWEPLVDIEPHGPPESSWVMPVIVRSGRIYAFYVYNEDNVREVPSPAGGVMPRVDTLGKMAFKYSDDGGRSWSADRWYLPMRVTDIDRANATGGAIQFFWGVGKPIVNEVDGAVYFGFSKVGDFVPDGFMSASEGWFYKSDNILTESDPAKINWELLPDGEVGLRAPIGPVADEHNLVALSDGSLYCTYRTIDGWLAHAYSRDGGHTWTPPEYATYTPGGRRIKHPRAANFVHRYSNGHFTLWYHNHGGKYYMDRNPAWLSGGVERDGHIHWSQPEIALYDEDDATRISYPDFIEQDGEYWITETQKTIARGHKVEPALLEGMWNQDTANTVTRDGLVAEASGAGCAPGATIGAVRLAAPVDGGGFSVDLWVTPVASAGEQEIFNTRMRMGRGIALSLLPWGAARLTVSDRWWEVVWESDRGLLTPGQPHHLVATLDGGPRIVTFVVDGVLCDGGEDRPKGWARFPRGLVDINGYDLAIAPGLASTVHAIRVYDRPLRTSEAVSNFNAGGQS